MNSGENIHYTWIRFLEGGKVAVRRIEELERPTVFHKALFVPPGYSSLLFAHLYEPNSCPYPTILFKGFKVWMHQRLKLRPSPVHKELQAIFSEPSEFYNGGTCLRQPCNLPHSI